MQREHDYRNENQLYNNAGPGSYKRGCQKGMQCEGIFGAKQKDPFDQPADGSAGKHGRDDGKINGDDSFSIG